MVNKKPDIEPNLDAEPRTPSSYSPRIQRRMDRRRKKRQQREEQIEAEEGGQSRDTATEDRDTSEYSFKDPFRDERDSRYGRNAADDCFG